MQKRYKYLDFVRGVAVLIKKESNFHNPWYSLGIIGKFTLLISLIVSGIILSVATNGGGTLIGG